MIDREGSSKQTGASSVDALQCKVTPTQVNQANPVME
jgi:hypothetical protein